MDRFLKQSEVLAAVGLSRQFVYKLRRSGHFPAPIILGVGALRWRESEIKAWKSRRGWIAAQAHRDMALDMEKDVEGEAYDLVHVEPLCHYQQEVQDCGNLERHQLCDIDVIEGRGYGAAMCTECFAHAAAVLTFVQKVELIATYPPAARKSKWLKDQGETWGF